MMRHKITSVSADDMEGQFLFQRLSSTVSNFNAILLQESFGSDDEPDFYLTSFFNLLSF